MAASLTRLITTAALAVYGFAKRRAALFAATAQLAPYIAGPLFILPASDSQETINGWKRYAAVIILFFFWERLVRTAVRVRTEKEQRDFAALQPAPQQSRRIRKDSSKNDTQALVGEAIEVATSTWSFTVWDKVWIIVSGIVIILTLDLFSGYFIEVIFALVLITFTCGALASFLQRASPQKRQRYLLGLSPQFIYLTGVGYLTCLAMRGDFLYQPLVIAAALAAVSMTPPLLKQLIKNDQIDSLRQTPEQRYLARAFALLICVAPVSIALMVYAGELPERYLAVFLCFIFGSPLLRRLQKSQSEQRLDPNLEWLGALTAGIFLAVIVIMRFV
jgi:hypothetical protein